MYTPISNLNLFSRLTSAIINALNGNIEYVRLSVYPIGATILFPAGSLTNYLKCDGSVVAQASFPLLYSVIGVTFGAGGAGNFTLPNLTSPIANMNYFIRYQ